MSNYCRLNDGVYEVNKKGNKYKVVKVSNLYQKGKDFIKEIESYSERSFLNLKIDERIHRQIEKNGKARFTLKHGNVVLMK